ncbi:quaternary ammonium compound resistance protein [Neokomagataea thailandica NBRC 106555]|uniref:QacE family quaternary ammonium compound efflux SMR transporter n=2 Tax=Neokomagataea TaxID=1223423 RepID=A0A4Y6V6I0_9PROT|nr:MULTISPECIES: SMR family transporter [Neokomagataea]QDH25669.1 QacE family quaternary ammonium compound efflux SMR transporter [Neokomagataea tanensis]GBR55319.1 quaternary ammonium compound resistance protein [Neokomagataea thailandica NBRC 106555]
MTYIYLMIAIVAETFATSLLKQSGGFTKIVPTFFVACGYIIAFYALSLALKDMPTGIAYAIWSGVGIIFISAVAWVFQGQKLDVPALIGMGLIIAGVIVINVFSKTGSH